MRKEGLAGHVLIKAADESVDRTLPKNGFGIFYGISADNGNC